MHTRLLSNPALSSFPIVQATGSGQQLMDLWRVDRHAEAAKFAQHSELDNRRLLWHGTNIAVVAAILKAGLRIMPHVCGRVGRGLYLANEQSKSAAYVTCGRKGKDLIGVGPLIPMLQQSVYATCTAQLRYAWNSCNCLVQYAAGTPQLPSTKTGFDQPK